jgi:hypothetical protein
MPQHGDARSPQRDQAMLLNALHDTSNHACPPSPPTKKMPLLISDRGVSTTMPSQENACSRCTDSGESRPSPGVLEPLPLRCRPPADRVVRRAVANFGSPWKSGPDHGGGVRLRRDSGSQRTDRADTGLSLTGRGTRPRCGGASPRQPHLRGAGRSASESESPSARTRRGVTAVPRRRRRVHPTWPDPTVRRIVGDATAAANTKRRTVAP